MAHGALTLLTKKQLRVKGSKSDFSKGHFSKVTVKEFPELGSLKAPVEYRTLWYYWLKVGEARTRQRFDQLYSERAQLLRTSPEKVDTVRHTIGHMKELGIAALPLMVEQIAEGDTSLVPLVSELVDGKVAPDATQAQCLAWWQANKERWLIPFDRPQGEGQTHDDAAGHG